MADILYGPGDPDSDTPEHICISRGRHAPVVGKGSDDEDDERVSASEYARGVGVSLALVRHAIARGGLSGMGPRWEPDDLDRALEAVRPGPDYGSSAAVGRILKQSKDAAVEWAHRNFLAAPALFVGSEPYYSLAAAEALRERLEAERSYHRGAAARSRNERSTAEQVRPRGAGPGSRSPRASTPRAVHPGGYLPAIQAARQAGLSQSRVAHAIAAGRLPCLRSGRKTLVRVEDIEAMQAAERARRHAQRTPCLPRGLVGKSEALALTGLSHAGLYNATRDGRIAMVKAGHFNAYSEAECLAFKKRRSGRARRLSA